MGAADFWGDPPSILVRPIAVIPIINHAGGAPLLAGFFVNRVVVVALRGQVKRAVEVDQLPREPGHIERTRRGIFFFVTPT